MPRQTQATAFLCDRYDCGSGRDRPLWPGFVAPTASLARAALQPSVPPGCARTPRETSSSLAIESASPPRGGFARAEGTRHALRRPFPQAQRCYRILPPSHRACLVRAATGGLFVCSGGMPTGRPAQTTGSSCSIVSSRRWACGFAPRMQVGKTSGPRFAWVGGGKANLWCGLDTWPITNWLCLASTRGTCADWIY